MIAAGFRHRTSRALDPQLHTHALVANAVERADGTWGAIDSRTLYRHAKTAGFVYQAVLRSELTQRLGVEWGDVRNGVAEATVVPDKVREMFSTRRREIEAEHRPTRLRHRSGQRRPLRTRRGPSRVRSPTRTCCAQSGVPS